MPRQELHSETPRLSVAVAATGSGGDVEAFLQTLAAQRDGQKVEIILAHCGETSALAKVSERHDVTLLRFPAGTTLPALWGAAIARSSGEIIAVTETACLPDSNWIASIIKAHEKPDPVIGGAVEIAAAGALLDWAAYFCEYGQFLRPLKEGAAAELPGNNISFKRWATEIGHELVEPNFWKTHWGRRLQAEGIVLQSTPAMVVYQQKSYRLLPFLIRRFHQGRCFAGMRIAWSSGILRAGFALGTGLLPVLILARIVKAVVPKRRYLREFVLSLPFSILAVLSWAAGEFCGYLAGPGRSCARLP